MSNTLKKCGNCKIEISIPQWRLRDNNYCSPECFGESRKGNSFSPSTQFKKAQKSLMGMLGKKHTIEWKIDRSRRFSGKNAPRYKENRESLRTDERHSHDTRYKYWSQSVKNRDGWSCKIHNHDCSGRVEAHHILGWRDFPELRYKLENGITLCRAHHPRGRAEEKRLVPYLQELVSVSKD